MIARAVLAAALALVALPASASEPSIIPRPLHAVEQRGAPLAITDGTHIVAPDTESRAIADYLADLSKRTAGPKLLAAGDGPAPAIRLVRRAGFAPEGYTLDVTARGAKITASTRAGLLYGAVSLWQLLTAAPDRRLAPVHIEDAPRFRWRGLLIDSARHFQSPAEIARMIEWMALHKLNRLQWHLADDQGWRLAVPGYPRLTEIAAWRSSPPAAGLVPGRYGGFYTRADVHRLVALAARRNITIVPEIDMPGHATAAILAYPRVGMTSVTTANVGDWGVFPSIYGVDDAAFAFLHATLDEVMALFPSREIAIGGDEAVDRLWHASPAVQTKLKALGLRDEAALQAWFVGQIGAYLNAHGRRLVGWDEILADKALASGDIVLSWHGADGALAAAHAGHDVVMATAPTLYLDNRQSNAVDGPPGRGLVVGLADVYGFDSGNPPHGPDVPPLDASALGHVLGVQGQLWSEHIVSDARLEAAAFPRAAALAETGWTAADRRDWPGFVARLPAMLARYRALGIGADDGAVAVQAAVTRTEGGAHVAFDRQVGLGEIRYTTDGSAPTAASSRYSAPFDLTLPARVRAVSFAGAQPLSRETDLALDAVSATRRVSQQLDRCTDAVTLDLPGRAAAAGGKGPAYLLDIRNPCWIYRGADLSRVSHVAVGVAALPFNYQFANEDAQPPLPPTVSPVGELVIRDGCDGPTLATVPLDTAARGGVESELVAAVPKRPGKTDLCLMLRRPKPDPLWALDWVKLRP